MHAHVSQYIMEQMVRLEPVEQAMAAGSFVFYSESNFCTELKVIKRLMSLYTDNLYLEYHDGAGKATAGILPPLDPSRATS